MAYLPEKDEELIELVESVYGMFTKYEKIKKKFPYLPELKSKDPKKFKNFKKLIDYLVENIAYIENNLPKIKGIISNLPEDKKRNLFGLLNLLSKSFQELINAQKKINSR